MPRKSKLEKELINLWKDLGTLEFKSYSELGMMVNEFDPGKVRKVIHKLIDEDKIYLDFENGRWVLDYIPF